MRHRDLFGLFFLGMLWGVSFLFIRLAVPQFGAIALIAVRLTLAAAVLLPLLLWRRQFVQILPHWRAVSVLGVIQYALPFTLFAYSMLSLPAGYSSVINASAPLFAGMIARFWLGESLNTSRAAGLILGLAGVAVLVWDGQTPGEESLLAVLASVLGALCYGAAAVFAKKKLQSLDPTAVAGGSLSAAALILVPLTCLFAPAAVPSAGAWGMAVALGVFCTALPFVLYFRLVASIGPAKAITVTYLIPLFGVAFGAYFLHEHITGSMLAGGIIVMLGTALATGVIRMQALLPKRRAAVSSILLAVIVMTSLDDTPMDGWTDALVSVTHHRAHEIL